MGLAFLYPAFLIGALAAAVPIVLHLLKRETAPPVRFSAVRFLRRVSVERTRRQRLRELLLLALRVAALLLLAGAFARPYLVAGGSAGTGVTVVAIDTSFSVSAPGQFDEVRALARDAVHAAPGDHLVGVVAFDDAPRVLSEPSLNRGDALAAIDRARPGFGGTRYRPALAQAAGLVGARFGRIVLVTDLQRSGWDESVGGGIPERVEVQLVELQTFASNLAVTMLLGAPSGPVAVVRNGGAGSRTSRARLALDGRPMAEAEFTVEPGESIDVPFAVALPEAGVASVVLDDPLGYAADNARYLVLDPPAPPVLLLVSATGNPAVDALYVDRALQAIDESSGFERQALSTLRLTARQGLDLEAYAGVVLLSTRGLDRRAEQRFGPYLRQGGGVLIVAGEDVEPDVLAGAFGETVRIALSRQEGEPGEIRFAPVDARHPIFRPFGALAGNLGQVRFRRVQAIDESGWQVVARFSDGSAALVERRVGDGRLLLFTSDLDNRWNDFPLHPTFAPFVLETLRYVAGERREPTEYIVGNVPAGVARQPGVATVGHPARRVAVNIDARESEPARMSAEEFQRAISRLNQTAEVHERRAVQETEAQQNYWRYGLMLVLVALAAEGVLGRRAA